MQITLKQKDIEKVLTNSESGLLIDEIAYSIGESTSECIYNDDYLPEPYNFDFESDLLSNTKTLQALTDISNTLGVDYRINTLISGASPLQAGAQLALNHPLQFATLLKAYTEYVKEQHPINKIISPLYEKEREEAENDYYDQNYKEWLHRDRQNYEGVLYHIKKALDAIDIDYVPKTQELIIEIDDNQAKQELEDYYGIKRLTQKAYKDYIISYLQDKSNTRKQKDNAERLKRKEERERLAIYKAEQKAKADAERKEKLLKLTL